MSPSVCVCVCVCVSKQGKKKRGSFGSFQFISTNGFQASSDNQAAAAWSMHQRGREEMRIPSRDAKNSRHSAIQLLPCISSKTQTQNCALKHLPLGLGDKTITICIAIDTWAISIKNVFDKTFDIFYSSSEENSGCEASLVALTKALALW